MPEVAWDGVKEETRAGDRSKQTLTSPPHGDMIEPKPQIQWKGSTYARSCLGIWSGQSGRGGGVALLPEEASVVKSEANVR